MDKTRAEKTTVELTHEFFNTWLRTYQSTYGRLIEIPAMGPMRERYEKLMTGFSISINLYTAWIESIVNFQNVFIGAMHRMREKMTTEMERGISPEMYRDFYKVWIETYSETFKEFLKSGHFALDMGTLISYSTDFQKNNQVMFEENFLKPMGLPTRTEIDNLSKELYFHKKAVKELNSQVRELSRKR